MRYLLIITLIVAACSTEDPAPAMTFRATFIHNGTPYQYETGPENARTIVNPIHPGRVIAALNFYRGDSLHLTAVTALNLQQDTATLDGIREAFAGPVSWTLDPDVPKGLVYFSPFFHFSDNGGFLERDGQQEIIAEAGAQSDNYEQDGIRCYNQGIKFSRIYARSGVPGCGPDAVSCENLFEDGEITIQFCL